MPIHPALSAADLDQELLELLIEMDLTGNTQPYEDRLENARAGDTWAQPYASGQKGVKYYKPFVQTVIPQIVDTTRSALIVGTCPEIRLGADDFETTRTKLAIPRLGSPQDFLYGFTSDRYPNWGSTLEAMGFRSACMVGQGEIVVTMAPRFLDFTNPNLIVDELSGAIARDFWESSDIIFGASSFASQLADALSVGALAKLDLDHVSENTAEAIRDRLSEVIPELEGTLRLKAQQTLKIATGLVEIPKDSTRKTKTRNILRKMPKAKISQEQLALKYVDEGNFLQKLLDGARLEHIQSNVKMVKNPLRGNKCEVDSIYRVVGEKTIVLVEAKGKPRVSRTQLYQVYETYRLKLPNTWKVEVVAVTQGILDQELEETGVTQVIDLVSLDFDDSAFGNVTESLVGMSPRRHYRWHIRRTT